MDSLRIRLSVLLTLLFLCAAEAVLPNGECSVNGMTCEMDDNFIGIADNIASAEDCKLECKNSSAECRVYSYYGPAGVPFKDTCLLFRDCSVLDAVEDCVTEDTECATPFCNAPVEGILSDNVIDTVPDVSEADCEAECEVEEQCKFFTFHFSNSTLYPSTCFLLREIREPITACQDETCISGSPKCENSLCGFLEEGILFPSGIIVTETKEIDILTIGPCSVGAIAAVVVGGGGTTIYDAGSGSGYVEYQEIQFSRPYVNLEARVGLASKRSILRSISDGNSDVLVMALPGEDGGDYSGGNGYSGGGGDDGSGQLGGNGGYNGSNGEFGYYPGGEGSGFDVNSLSMTNFVLRYVGSLNN